MMAMQLLKGAGIECFIMPTPREAAASCGLSVRFPSEHFDEVSSILKKRGFEGCRFFYFVTESGRRHVVPLCEM
jgi:hypothetical protein